MQGIETRHGLHVTQSLHPCYSPLDLKAIKGCIIGTRLPVRPGLVSIVFADLPSLQPLSCPLRLRAFSCVDDCFVKANTMQTQNTRQLYIYSTHKVYRMHCSSRSFVGLIPMHAPKICGLLSQSYIGKQFTRMGLHIHVIKHLRSNL